MDYSNDKPFKDREHILWEIGYCNKATTYITVLCLVFAALGIVSDLLSMKLALGGDILASPFSCGRSTISGSSLASNNGETFAWHGNNQEKTTIIDTTTRTAHAC